MEGDMPMRKSIASLLFCTVLASACATSPATQTAQAPARPANIKEWVELQSRAKKRAVVGALIGAALGAATASITGGDAWSGAAAGALTGAVAGFAVGKRQDRLYAGRDSAVRQAKYDSSQGYVARVEEVVVAPPQAKPGQTTTLYVRYLVIGPDQTEAVKVTMFGGLKYGDDYIFGTEPNQFIVPQGGGIVEARIPVTLPKKAPAGTYGVEALIDDPQGRFSQAVGTSSLYIVASTASRRADGVRIASR
jgi:hypothetical protein